MRFLALTLAATVTASPTLALDDCLIGTWQADLNALAQIMGAQMNGNATPVGGSVLMTVTPDGMANMTINNMVINVTVPDVPPMDVTVRGASSGNFTGDGGTWSVVTASYNLVGSANVMGQTMTIPFTSDTGMFGSDAGSYTCSASALTFTSNSPDGAHPAQLVTGLVSCNQRSSG